MWTQECLLLSPFPESDLCLPGLCFWGIYYPTGINDGGCRVVAWKCKAENTMLFAAKLWTSKVMLICIIERDKTF